MSAENSNVDMVDSDVKMDLKIDNSKLDVNSDITMDLKENKVNTSKAESDIIMDLKANLIHSNTLKLSLDNFELCDKANKCNAIMYYRLSIIERFFPIIFSGKDVTLITANDVDYDTINTYLTKSLKNNSNNWKYKAFTAGQDLANFTIGRAKHTVFLYKINKKSALQLVTMQSFKPWFNRIISINSILLMHLQVNSFWLIQLHKIKGLELKQFSDQFILYNPRCTNTNTNTQLKKIDLS
eukprot:511550_1